MTPKIAEVLQVFPEPSNPFDAHAVAILKDNGTIVGHVLRELSRVICSFIVEGGTVVCEVTGHRKYGKGLEIPCTYKSLEQYQK